MKHGDVSGKKCSFALTKDNDNEAVKEEHFIQIFLCIIHQLDFFVFVFFSYTRKLRAFHNASVFFLLLLLFSMASLAYRRSS